MANILQMHRISYSQIRSEFDDNTVSGTIESVLF